MADIYFSSRPNLMIEARLYSGTSPAGAMSMLEITGTGEYLCDMPISKPAGRYLVVFFEGGKKLGSGFMRWDGVREVLSTPVVMDDAVSNDIATRVANIQIEDGATLRGSLKLMNSFVAGRVRGAGSNVEKFSNLTGTHDVIVSTNDANGNRREVRLNLQD